MAAGGAAQLLALDHAAASAFAAALALAAAIADGEGSKAAARSAAVGSAGERAVVTEVEELWFGFAALV